MGISLDVIFLFEAMKLGEETSEFAELRYTMLRKELIDENGNFTVKGNELYQSLFLDESTVQVVKKIKEGVKSGFEKWWEIFPSTDSFIYNGKGFGKTRGLRINKKRCEELFNKLVNSGKYTADEIIKATLEDVITRKTLSCKTGDNKLSYIQNSATYLYQEAFEPHIKNEVVTEINAQPATNVVDI